MDQPETRHELSNLLSVALASVEAMLDGLIPPTTSRLEAIADSLRRASELLQRATDAARKA